MTYVAYKKIIFPRNAILVALLYSGFISSTIKTISIQNSSCIPFGCKKCVFLHDTRLWFPDYSSNGWNPLLEVRKTARTRNRYNQVPHIFQDTKLESNKITVNITNKSQEVCLFPSCDHKAAKNRRESMTNTRHN